MGQPPFEHRCLQRPPQSPRTPGQRCERSPPENGRSRQHWKRSELRLERVLRKRRRVSPSPPQPRKALPERRQRSAQCRRPRLLHRPPRPCPRRTAMRQVHRRHLGVTTGEVDRRTTGPPGMAATDDHLEETIDRRSCVTRCQHRDDSAGAVMGCCISCARSDVVDIVDDGNAADDTGASVHGRSNNGSSGTRSAHRRCRASPRSGASCGAGDASSDDRPGLDGRCSASGDVGDHADHPRAAGDHNDRSCSCRDVGSLRCLPLSLTSCSRPRFERWHRRGR